jgi:uncharacterized repeat protein (TIGR03803 family)
LGGTLYGTTYRGGSGTCHQTRNHGGCGTVFSVTTAGVETVVHVFKGGPDGRFPAAGLVRLGDALYGTTAYEGANGSGTVFKVTKEGGLRTLYSFKGGSDGATPLAGLINVGGTLYGTTYAGGANNLGTVFAVTKTGTETVLYSFKGGADDGANPQASLINVGGTLYGTTVSGGTESTYCRSAGNTCGTVFKVTTSGAETVLYSFKGYPDDGSNPYAGLVDLGGTLYGTTTFGGAAPYGGGTVFSVTAAGAETIVYSFQGGNDGVEPTAGLVNVGSTLYGTTSKGGPNFCGSPNAGTSCGTVFKVTTSGAEKVLYAFEGGGDGWNPEAGLIDVGGTLYGTTYKGGSGNCREGYGGCGTVYAITR